MTRYSVQPRDRIFVKGYGFLSFAKNIGRNIGHSKQSTTDAFKTSSKRVTQKTAEATVDWIGKKIADEITRAPGTSPQNNLETNEEVLREK